QGRAEASGAINHYFDHLVRNLLAESGAPVAVKSVFGARVRARRLASMARQKIEDTDQGSVVLPNALRRELDAVANGGVSEERAEAALAEALAISLNQTKDKTISQEQRELAEKLHGNERTTTLNDWLERQVLPTEETDRKVETALAELSMF